MVMASRLVAWVLSLGFTLVSFANTMSQDFKEAQKYTKSLSGESLNAVKQFHPESIFKDYQSSVSEEHFYQGIEVEKAELSSNALQALKNDAGGKVIVEHFGEKQFDINKNSTAIKNAKLIEEESYALTHGMSNEKVNCEEPYKDCEFKTHEEVCHTSRRLPEQVCSRKLIVSVNSEHIRQRADFEVWVASKWTGLITVNLITGAISAGEKGSLSNPLKLTRPCEQISTVIHSVNNNGKKANWVTIAAFPSCQNNASVKLRVNEKFDRHYPLQIALTVEVTSKAYVSDEHWENDCQHLENSGLCQKKKEECRDGIATRVIDGLPVSRDCWHYDATYSCSSAKADECQSQREKGCLQLSSRCLRLEHNGCALYEQVYGCEEKICPVMPACVKNLFCADGECTDSLANQFTDFSKAVLPLAVVGEAGREFAASQTSFFAGRPVQCKVWLANLVDCCSHKGWADKINLDLCREEDKALGKAKLNYLAHYVGKYCSQRDPVLGACLEHKRTYCIFDSKMARIVQEEGRLKQLNPKALGDAEHTSCPGLTVDELQQLDLGRIDFLNPVYPYPFGEPTKEAGIVGDVGLNTPNAHASVEEIKNRLEQKVNKS